MRISETEKQVIKSTVAALDPGAKVYLYGSRADDSLRGGDIDLLIVSGTLDFSDKITLLTDIKTRIGEQKIDLLVKSESELTQDAFIDRVLPTAILL